MIGRVNQPESVRQLTLSVVGSGYVGLVTAACLARMGHVVQCIDRDENKISELKRGVVSFREPGLDEAVAEGLANGRLTFADSSAPTTASQAVLIAVGTLDPEGSWTDRYVESAVCALARDPHAPRTIIIRSTLLPGTTMRLQAAVREIDSSVELAFNPEFTRQGTAVRDFFTPDRIVVGGTTERHDSEAKRVLMAAYAALNAPVIVTDATSAELIKVGANAYLAMKIGFANEIARVAAATDADIATVIDGIGLDNRIGTAFLTPGPGFGGSCLPSQARALPALAVAHGIAAPILSAIDPSNRLQALWVVQQLELRLGPLDGARVAVLGLTFKAGTDDMRESCALGIGRELAARGAHLTVHDPIALAAGVRALANEGIVVDAAADPSTATLGANAVVIATEWPAYRAIDWTEAARNMKGRTIIDARGIADREAVSAAGLDLVVHGRHIPSTRISSTRS
jgi:UDPglucose 6-dehydrogenase